MKKLLIALMLFNSAYGQSTHGVDSIGFDKDSTNYLFFNNGKLVKKEKTYIISGGGSVSYLKDAGKPDIIIDTVMCFMQVNDTTARYHIDYYLKDNKLVSDTVHRDQPDTFIMFGMYGYRVIEKMTYYDIVVTYLDADKKPLKNIVVWNSIEVK